MLPGKKIGKLAPKGGGRIISLWEGAERTVVSRTTEYRHALEGIQKRLLVMRAPEERGKKKPGLPPPRGRLAVLRRGEEKSCGGGVRGTEYGGIVKNTEIDR